MQWETLLSPARLGKRDPASREEQRSAFQRDYDRVIFSSAFRRLQDKTQVFPLAGSDYVRTRLTHSLEAACVGRSLGAMVGAEVVKRHQLRGIHSSDVGAIVAAACLAHDIGNPPFGHSGEDAIRHWFAASPVARRVAGVLSEAQRADFEKFEGNAQGFRILTRLQMPDNRGGLQLTCATLGAFAKYPRPSYPKRDPKDRRVSAKKFSYFHAEADLFDEVAQRTGLIPSDAGWRRHPLSFLVEAADDICYRLVDFEDGVRLRLISYQEAAEAFVEVIGNPKFLDIAARMHGDEARIEFLRAIAIGEAIGHISRVFLDHEADILEGRFEQPLLQCTPVSGAMDAIVRRSVSTLYRNPRGLEIEAAGFEVVGGLLDLFVEAVEAAAQKEAPLSPRWRNLLELVPEPSVGPGRKPAPDAYTRLLRMTDYVSGMADSSAVSLYKKLRGISLPGQ
ncbi:MAG: deoxyguanosinetriphosphate triphosphohydrolase [Chthoniobacteraceae bacterium]